MTSKITCRGAAPALLGSALILLLSCPPAIAQPEQDLAAPIWDTEYFDVNFLTSLIDHHAVTVAMAELCAGRALHADLLAMCAQMTVVRTAEIAELQASLTLWYDLQHEPTLDDDELHQIEMLGSATGEEFEIMFLTMMIAHHHGATKVANLCAGHAEHAELTDLCAVIHDAQAQEIAQMRAWLCDWYGICDDSQSPAVATTWGALKALHH